MKRKFFDNGPLKRSILAVPAAALMLGASQIHAGTSIGVNFWGAYGSYGYGSTPVTAAAFGVQPASWINTPSGDWVAAATGSMTSGNLTLSWSAPNTWISTLYGDPASSAGAWNSPLPGNPEVLWGYLDDGNASSQAPAASLAGLASLFPNGYAVQTIAAEDAFPMTFAHVTADDGTLTNNLAYAYTWNLYDWYGPGKSSGGTAGLSAPSRVFNGDTLSLNCDLKGSTGTRSVLCGFIVTDQPLLTFNSPSSVLVLAGLPFTLPAPSVVGIGLTYQWQLDGINIPGATYPTYTNTAASLTSAGTYQAVVSSTYFPSVSVTGVVATVSVVPMHAPQTSTWDATLTTAGAQDGSGTWAYANTNWWTGSKDDYWNATDSAIFGVGGAGSYNVTLSDSISANQITFHSGGYTLTNGSGQTLALIGAATLTADSGAAATIAVPVSATNTLLKAGAGAVSISGPLSSPRTVVTAGSLEVLSKNGDSPYVITNSGTLKLGYSTGGGYANTAMQIYGSGASATNGLYLKGGVTYNVSGTLSLLGAPTTIRQYGTGLAALGIFDINSTGLSCSSAASGSVISSGVQFVNDGYGMAAQVDAGTNNANGDLTLNGPLNVTGKYGLYKRGAGSLRLNAVAGTANGALNLQAGTVICGTTNCLGSNAVLTTVAGATFNLNGFNQTVSNLALAGNLVMTINKGANPSSVMITVNGVNSTLGGTLTVTNLGAPLALGDTFTLFSAAGFGASFNTLNLPVADGLAWEDDTAANGTIRLVTGSVPPSLVTDLDGSTNYAYVGGSSTFRVTASGDPILHYHWLQNGVTPVGTDSPTLTLSGVTAASAGYYSVLIVNHFGQAQSQTNYLVVATPSTYVAAVLQDSPQDFWPLNETDPSTAYDWSRPNNGSQDGNLSLGVSGPPAVSFLGLPNPSLAYGFDGFTTYVNLNPGPALAGTTDFTLEAWISTPGNGASSQIILQQRYSAGYNGEYQFGLNATGNLTLMVYGGGAYQFNFASTNQDSLNDSAWHHVAAVRSGSTGYLYADGRLIGAATGGPAPLDPTFMVFIGADMRNSANYFLGSMCDMAIYSHALPTSHLAKHFWTGVDGQLLLGRSGNSLIWSSGTLLSSPVLGPSAVWTPVAGATSPYALPPAGSNNGALFYRLQW